MEVKNLHYVPVLLSGRTDINERTVENISFQRKFHKDYWGKYSWVVLGGFSLRPCHLKTDYSKQGQKLWGNSSFRIKKSSLKQTVQQAGSYLTAITFLFS